MDIEKHNNDFLKIIKKYDLFSEQKAGEIADYLTKHRKGKVSTKEFSELFLMSEEEAYIFLSFIDKGLKFKEKHLDKK